ncbi:MAG TPA: YceI family protein [Dehalococcoidia bacterium]|nr:YceI family protein [Dehalococcoidia bacterium]
MFSLRRAIIAAVSVAALAAVAAGTGWWFFVREDNQLATAAPAVPTDIATAATAGDALTYTIIPSRSEASYFADEKLASLPLPSTAKGTTTDIQGVFHLAPGGISLDPAKTSQFTVNLTTLKSDRDMRDRRVQSTLQTSQYPTATFTATTVTGYDASLPAGAEQTLRLTGTLNLHGVQKEVTWDVKARKQGNVITGLATLTFPFEQFNLSPPNIAGFVSVQDHVTLQVQIVAQS